MNFVLHGASVSSGITIGHAHLVSTARLEVGHYEIAEAAIEDEVARFNLAVGRVRDEFAAIEAHIPPGSPAEFGALVNVHRMILEDSTLSQVPQALIRERRCNAEWALVQQMERLVEQFDSIDDPYLRERKADVEQVVERVLKALMGTDTPPAPQLAEEQNLIVVAHDLAPADMILFKRHHFGGFVTDVGGVTSHSAILARSLGIPALAGLHHARHMIREGELVIVDGTQGVMIVDPDPLVLQEYQLRQSQLDIERQKLKRLRTTRAATLDGTAVELFANIELPQDIAQVLEAGAEGVGLFRTEFLFMNRRDLPSEDEQFEAYRDVAQAMGGRPVVLRTLDVGADKALHGDGNIMPNPAMGLRAIRYCLAEPQMFLTQLRAILRASTYGQLRILLPMLVHPHEVEQALALLRQAKQQLDERGERYVAPGRRHDRDPGRGACPACLHAAAQLLVTRHERLDPVHAGDRSCRRRGRASLRSDAPGGVAPGRANDPDGDTRRCAGGGMRRDGRRPDADSSAAWLRAAQFLHASDAGAYHQGARAEDRPRPDPDSRAARAAQRRPGTDSRADREAQRLDGPRKCLDRSTACASSTSPRW